MRERNREQNPWQDMKEERKGELLNRCTNFNMHNAEFFFESVRQGL